MSVFGGIAAWIETRLEAQVSALTDVKAIAAPEEFEIVGRHVPAAGIMVVAGEATDDMTLDGEQLITIDVGIWVSSRALQGGPDLSQTNGLYDLFDDIHAAIKQQTPTGAFEPLRYLAHDTENLDGGLAVMVMQYRTAAII